jgi:hypothetical protein
MEFLWFFAIPVVIIVLGASVNLLFENKRIETVKRIATEMGFEFKGNADIPSSAWSLNSLSRKHPRSLVASGKNTKNVTNLIQRQEENLKICIFDYEWDTTSKRTYPHYRTVVLFQSNTLALPHFSVEPRILPRRVSHILGRESVDFPEHLEFSHRYRVRGDSEGGVRQLFGYRIADFFRSRQDAYVEGKGNILVYYSNSYCREEPKRLKSLLQEALDFYKLFSSDHQDLQLGSDVQVEM